MKRIATKAFQKCPMTTRPPGHLCSPPAPCGSVGSSRSIRDQQIKVDDEDKFSLSKQSCPQDSRPFPACLWLVGLVVAVVQGTRLTVN